MVDEEKIVTKSVKAESFDVSIVVIVSAGSFKLFRKFLTNSC